LAAARFWHIEDVSSATTRRLNELEWALARLLHRPREARRTSRYFGVAWSPDGHNFTQAYPVDISVDGVALITPEELKTNRFVVTLEIGNRRVQAAAQCVSVQKGTLRGNIVWRIGARFVEIAREARALIDRFVRRLPLAPDPPQLTLGVFPESVTRRILAQLVQLERLAPPRWRMQPLVKMAYAGIIRRGKQLLHSVKIESRIVQAGATTVYHSQAYVSARLTNVEVVPLDNGVPEGVLLQEAR